MKTDRELLEECGAIFPQKEPLIIKINQMITKEEMERLRLNLQHQAVDKPVVLLPYYADLVSGYTWTPCEVKPPKDGWYLVTTKSRRVKMSYFKHGPNRDSWVMGATKPIAWMPLPEGYKK